MTMIHEFTVAIGDLGHVVLHVLTYEFLYGWDRSVSANIAQCRCIASQISCVLCVCVCVNCCLLERIADSCVVDVASVCGGMRRPFNCISTTPFYTLNPVEWSGLCWEGMFTQFVLFNCYCYPAFPCRELEGLRYSAIPCSIRGDLEGMSIGSPGLQSTFHLNGTVCLYQCKCPEVTYDARLSAIPCWIHTEVNTHRDTQSAIHQRLIFYERSPSLTLPSDPLVWPV